MILEKGQCVICDTPGQVDEVRCILMEAGYKFHHGKSLDFLPDVHGYRFWKGGKFPNCIASLNKGMVYDARKNGEAGARNEGIYEVFEYHDFMNRINTVVVSVEDML